MNQVLRTAVASALLMMAGGVVWPEAAWAQAPASQQTTFNIPAGDLGVALKQFTAQGHVQLVYSSAVAEGKKTTGVSGRHAVTEALEQVLAGTGLVYEFVSPNMVVIKVAPAMPTKRSAPAVGETSAEPAATDLQTVAVTGTRIRGGVSASPTITIDEQKFKEEGFTDLGEVIRSIPQNYKGGQNPGVANGASIGNATNYNRTGGSALNLRGLGPDATLTLLNGRRLSYDGIAQAVDISAIPIEAVERMEIVPDGASAIYGSDAVGGRGQRRSQAGFRGGYAR